MSQQHKVGTVATTIYPTGNHTAIKYHRTDVVKFNDHEVILNSGGWRSATTKTRMNQAANQYGLGFSVFQAKGEWYVDHAGQRWTFTDGMILSRV